MVAPLAAVAMPTNGPVALTLEAPGVPALTFNTGQLDAAGVDWIVEDVEGWDMAEVALPVLPRFGVDGSWIGAGYYRQRNITLRGVLLAPTLAAAQAASDHLIACANLVRNPGTLTVHEATPRAITVNIAARVRLDRTLAGGRGVRFEIPLVAGDPRRYATVEESRTFGTVSTIPVGTGFELPLAFGFAFGSAGVVTGGTAVDVGGNTPTWPRLTFRGPSSAPALINVTTGNATWRYTGTLAAGERLEVDLDAATVLLGGVESRYHLVDPASTWWPLIPGRNVLRYEAAGAGTGDVTVRWRSAWL